MLAPAVTPPPTPQTAPAQPALDESQARFLERFGYLRIERMTDAADVALIRREVGALFARRAGYAEGMFFDFAGAERAGDAFAVPQLCGAQRFAPALLRTRFYSNALAIARQLLGPDARLTQDHAIMKPAHSAAATPWHQDEAFGDPRLDYHEVSFWLALQDVDEVNGCMRFVPGSHRGGVVAHAPPGGDRLVHAVECAAMFDPALAVSCPLPSGGCSLHTTRTIHGAGPNLSDAPRWAYVMVFGRSPTQAAAARAYPWLRGRDTPRMRRRRAWMLRGGVVVAAWRKLMDRLNLS